MATVTFNVLVHEEDDGSLWSEVKELPGCFASGFDLEELQEATFEAIQLWLPDGIVLGDPEWTLLGDDEPKPKARSMAKKKMSAKSSIKSKKKMRVFA
jgi:predicted RNase H-like HicB family nuclease